MKNSKVSPQLKKVLSELAQLNAVHYLLKELGLFLSVSLTKFVNVTFNVHSVLSLIETSVRTLYHSDSSTYEYDRSVMIVKVKYR